MKEGCGDLELIRNQSGSDTEGKMAPSTKLSQNVAFGFHAAGGGLVVERAKKVAGGAIVFAGLHGDRALAGCGQHLNDNRCVEFGGDDVMPETVEAGLGQNSGSQGGGVSQLPEPGRNIAANVDDFEIGSEMKELILPPWAGGGHDGMGRERGEAAGRFADQHVRRVGPLEDGGQG